jgi:hypothetical protein
MDIMEQNIDICMNQSRKIVQSGFLSCESKATLKGKKNVDKRHAKRRS